MGTFGRCLVHEGGVFMNALIKETQESSLAPFHHVSIQREVCNLEEGPHLTILAA